MTFHLPNDWTVHTGRARWLPFLHSARVAYHGVEAATFWGLDKWETFMRAYNAAWRQADD